MEEEIESTSERTSEATLGDRGYHPDQDGGKPVFVDRR